MVQDKIEYNALSPDGITLTFDETYESEDKAKEAITNWCKRYEHQGYYRDNRWNKIPVSELPDHCEIITLINGRRVS